jgi:hypothetical protein
MSDDSFRQAVVDGEHLKLLSLGYMVSAATTAFFSIFGLFYMVMGIFMSAAISHEKGISGNPNQAPPAFMGWFLGAMGFAIFLFTAALAAAKLRTAFCIKRRSSRTFCMVVAGISCLGIPYGTILGVFSFIVLGRDSVAPAFDSRIPPASSEPMSHDSR